MIDLQALVTAQEAAELAAKDILIASLQQQLTDCESSGGGGSGDLTPDPFTFTPVTNALQGVIYTSNEVTITGINEAVIVRSSVPFSKNGGPWITVDTAAVAGDKFRLQVASSLVPNIPLSGALTVGSVTSLFTVTTADRISPSDMFPQQVHRAWLQEDLLDGEVSSWLARGRNPATPTQSVIANRPVKLPNQGGVYFQKGLPKRLGLSQDSDAAYSHRWWTVIAKVDMTNATGDGQIVCINGTGGANINRQPFVWFNKADNTMISSVADGSSHALRGPIDTNGWQVLFCYRRGSQVHYYINGQYIGFHDFTAFRVPNVSVSTSIGQTSGNVGADTWIDSAWFGDGELTDEQIECMLGWAHHRAGRQDLLPVGHRFKTNPPRVADMPARHAVYQHDSAVWSNFNTVTDSTYAAHRGEQTYTEAGYVTVFKTDFDRADQMPQSDLIGAKNSPWFAPYWNEARPQSARWRETSGLPCTEAYLLDTSGTGTLALRLLNVGGVWKTGAMCTVNNNGLGRAWGNGIFKFRYKYSPGLTPPYPGIFDAFWAYSREHLFQRTRMRIEPDWMENTGKDGAFSDANLHVHKGQFAFPADPTIVPADLNERIGDRVLSPTHNFPITFNMFDGNWHEVAVRVTNDITYWYNGQGGIYYETARCPTIPALSMLKYLIVDRALASDHGNRDLVSTEIIDYVVDSVEVMQLATDLEIIPNGFSALPVISKSGLAITVVPNTVGSHIEYRYYANGVPIVLAEGSNPTLDAEWTGKNIRCHVKNLSLASQPEAWSGEITL